MGKVRNCGLSATKKIDAKDKRELTTYFALLPNCCCAMVLFMIIFKHKNIKICYQNSKN